jgi:hypothetical protein
MIRRRNTSHPERLLGEREGVEMRAISGVLNEVCLTRGKLD